MSSGHEATADAAATRGLDRRWLIAHLASLLAILVVMLIAARGQYFYYDEWDFLAERAEWNLLGTHVGHLSFFPQLWTTLVKGVFGLHTYWPFLLPTIAVHLLVVHLIWRVMMRSAVLPFFALMGALLFGVLAPAAGNTMWAFQIGFITPFALGLAALLIAMRPTVGTRETVWIAVLMVIAIGFAGTALPMLLVVAAYLAVRHGWRAAIVPVAAFGIVYVPWYLIFNTGSFGWDYMKADTPWELIIGVPQFVAHGFVDSVAQFLPLAALSPVLLVMLAGWVLVELRRTGVRNASPSLYLLAGLFVFAVLTAFSRVGLGNSAASADRYAYVYGLLLMAASMAALTALVRGGRSAIAAVLVILTILVGYNAGGLVVAANSQAEVERTVPRAMSAALAIDDGSDGLAERHPAAVIAPTLTMADIRSFVERGQFTPVEYTPSDALDVRINLLLSAQGVAGDAPDITDCESADNGGAFPIDPETQLVYVPSAGHARVHASEDGAFTQYAEVVLQTGLNRLTGLEDADIRIRLDGLSGLCVIDMK